MECAWCRHTVYNRFRLKYIFVSLSLSKCKEATTNCIMRFFSDVYIHFINMLLWFSLHTARCLLSTIVWVRARVCIFFNESEKKKHNWRKTKKKKVSWLITSNRNPITGRHMPFKSMASFNNFFLSITLYRSLFLFWISLFFRLNCSFPSKFEWKKHLFRLKKYYRKV